VKRFDRYFDGADGLRLAAMVRGPEDGQPVLLAHGGGQTHWAWRKTVAALADAGFHAVAIDLRGHGDSDRAPDANYSNSAYARDILAVASQLGDHIAMVGASLGGIAGMIAEGDLSPGRFASLTLVDITARPDMAGVERISRFMGTHVEKGFASLDEAAEVIAGYTKGRARRGPSDSLARYLRKGEDGRYRWHWDPAFMSQFDANNLDQRAQMDRAVGNLNLPVHLVRGGSSDLVTPEGAREFLALVPHAEFTDIAGAGHMVVGDRNDIFSASIIAFLEQHRQG
jgi:pimeloyl-ACP methyl ester carboxylesterase